MTSGQADRPEMHELEHQFSTIAQEWLALESRSLADVQRWQHRLAALLTEEEGLRDAGRWVHGRTDFLGVVGKHRDELVHSRLIGWLLDPCGHHGLGSSVLSAVLAAAGLTPASPNLLCRARVRLEVPVAEGRLDIVVEAPGLYLVIENKVDASEGPGQCAYYVENVQHAFKCFILLTPDGRAADDAPVVRPLSYAAFARLLESAIAESSSSGDGRAVAVDYLRTLRMEF